MDTKNSKLPAGFEDPGLIIDSLGEFISERRKARIEEVIANRTYSVVPVVEGAINRGNVSAIVRSAEAFGFQSVHVVSGEEPFKNSARTSQGAEKWLDIYDWQSAEACIDNLKARGYFVAVTALSDDAVPVDELLFRKKVAMVFGNEAAGVSDYMIDASDAVVKIPMNGFVDSFNISVAAALCMYQAHNARVKYFGRSGDLTKDQLELLRAKFYYLSVQNAAKILERQHSI